jgi:predicted transporter
MLIQCSVCKKFLMSGTWVHYEGPFREKSRESEKDGKKSARVAIAVCPTCSGAVAREFKRLCVG